MFGAKRIPTLDGWRGIAILMVLFDHAYYSASGNCYPHLWLSTGGHGVSLFFVLSGFLITSVLLSEPISLTQFYTRRFFRLMPTAWTFVATFAVLYLAGIHWTSWEEIRGCLFFYRNYQGHTGGAAGHFWSLSVEEQFYLVWPSLLLCFGVRSCRWISAIGAVSIACFRFAFWSYYTGDLRMHTEVTADALLIGCLLALLIEDPGMRYSIALWSKRLVIPSAILFVTAIAIYRGLHPLWESVCIACLLAFTSLHPGNGFSRLLEWRPLAWLGTISYSLYVWQEPFTFLHGKYSLILSGFLLATIALSSHYWLEAPLRRFGRRLSESRPLVLGEESKGFPTR